MPEHAQPDILLIMPDQMRGDCLSLERHPVLTTPNIDAIGGGGVHFRRAYTTCPSCIPARRAMLTGQYPATNGMPGFTQSPLTAPTMPACLAEAGYRTAIVGRNMHQYPHDEPYGYEVRIDGSTYLSDPYAEELEAMYPGQGGVKAHGVSFNGHTARPWMYADSMHPTAWISRKSQEFLEADDGSRPLFLTSSYYAPHPPLIPPAYYFQRYDRPDLPPRAIGDWVAPLPNDGLGLPVDSARCDLHGDQLRAAQAGYFGLIEHLDHQLYWLITDFKSRARKHKRPWLIVFTSDHGEMLGDHHYFRKCEPFEGSARIPFLIQASPELGLRPGRVVDTPVCLEDLMPTFLDAAGAAVPDGVDGRSLWPVLRDGGTGVREWLHSEHAACYSREQAYQALTDGRWKYIWRPETGRELLFDLDADPQELHDASGDQPQLLKDCRRRLVAILHDRPEGFVADGALVAGRDTPGLLPHATRPS